MFKHGDRITFSSGGTFKVYDPWWHRLLRWLRLKKPSTTTITLGPVHRAVAGTSLVCMYCRCRWKQYADKTVSLYDTTQRPCHRCNNGPISTLMYEEE